MNTTITNNTKGYIMEDNTSTNNNTNVNAEVQNRALLEKKPREVKKYKFADGEYRVPTEYVCTKCGQKYHVRQEVLITRIQKKYGNSMERFLKEATCSHCNKEAKLDEQIKKLQAQKEQMIQK